MGSMIDLSECKDKNILNKFKKLKSNIPTYLENEAEYNPFIQYIESVGRIHEDLLNFLYHSEFLSLLTEQTIPFVKTLYDRGAEIEWFCLIQKGFEEFADEADEYVALLMECFECQEDVAVVEELLEASEMTEIDVFRKKVEEYRKRVNEGKGCSSELYEKHMDDNVTEHKSDSESDSSQLFLETRKEQICAKKNALEKMESKYLVLKEEKEQLSKQYEEVFNTLQNTYMVIRGNKEQEQQAKSEIERLKKNHVLKDKFIALEKARSAELIMLIQKLEDTNDVLVDEIADLKRNLEAAKEEIEHSRQELAELQMRGVPNPEKDYIADDVDDFESKPKEENSLINVSDKLEHEEDYSDISFVYDEATEEESVKEDIVEETVQQKAEPYEYTDVEGVVSNKGVIKKKCRWFLDNLFDYSRKKFLKKSREEQENLIFMKMMELHLPVDYQRSVRETLTNLGDTIPCFDLYKLICTNPTSDELMSFLSGFQMSAAEE